MPTKNQYGCNYDNHDYIDDNNDYVDNDRRMIMAKNADNDDDNFACRPHMTLRGCEGLRAIQLVTVLLYTGRALLKRR